LQALEHGGAHLLWGLLLVVEFLFVHAVLGSQEGSQFLATLLQVHFVLDAHLLETALHHLLGDDFVGLVLPLGSEGQVLVTVDLGEVLLQFEFVLAARVDVGVRLKLLRGLHT
jgi:hypothetical protein